MYVAHLLYRFIVKLNVLNVSKSKFMLIGGPKKLSYFSEVTLSINDRRLDRVNSYKYLGVIITRI